MREPQIPDLDSPSGGRLHRVDPAATNIAAAEVFYAGMFGWRSSDKAMNGGHFRCFSLSGRDLGSAHPLSRAQRERGVPSHWARYVEEGNADDALIRAAGLGGTATPHPVIMTGLARIALVLDPVSAVIAPWGPAEADIAERPHVAER